MRVQDGVRYFEHLGCYYRRLYQEPTWVHFRDHVEDPWEALALLLRGYAFERAGRSPEFAPAAADAVLSAREAGSSTPRTGDRANLVWKTFRELLPRRKLNRKVNPLYPSSDPDGLGVGEHPSLVETAFSPPVNGQPLTVFCRDLIQGNEVDVAFSLLTEARGIGKKIASFVLRDLGAIYGVGEGVDNRHLLQPIDLWVRRVVLRLAEDDSLSDTEVAEWIVNRSLDADVSPEWANAGMWFMGAVLAESEYLLDDAMASVESARKLEADYHARIERAASCR